MVIDRRQGAGLGDPRLTGGAGSGLAPIVANHTKDTIIGNLVTALEGIQVDLGYEFTVALVTRKPMSIGDLLGLKAPVLHLGSTDSETYGARLSGGFYQATVTPVVTGVYKSRGDLVAEASEFQDNVKRCLCSCQPLLGDMVRDVKLKSDDSYIDQDNNDQDAVVFFMEIEILYMFDGANP
jgi:hypothetical protein